MNFVAPQCDVDNETFVSCFDELPLWSAPFGIRLLEMVEYRQNIAALDIGFGTGFPMLELAMRLGTSSVVYGIDPWQGAIRRTKKKAAFYEINNIAIIESTASEIPLADNSIDLIVSNNGLNNVPDVSKTIGECNRIAKSNCQFVTTMNLSSTMSEFYTLFKKSFIDKKLSSYVANIQNHIHEKRPEIKALEHIFAKHNFYKSREIRDSFSYKFASGTALFNHHFFKLAFIDCWVKCIPLKHQKVILSDLEKKINIIAQHHNGFTLTVPLVCIEFRKR
jgi:ubiquinone/menaquinone biosynthesis C-methylase UbiE